MEKVETNKEFNKEVEKEILEIIEKAHKSENKMSKEEVEKLRKELDINENFLSLLDTIDISASNYRVIVTIGRNELLYDNGEFYIVDAIDIKRKKKKISKKDAKDLYIEYFIRYVLNPMLEKNKMKATVNEKNIEIPEESKDKKKKEEKVKEQKKEKKKKEEKQKESKKQKEEVERTIE